MFQPLCQCHADRPNVRAEPPRHQVSTKERSGDNFRHNRASSERTPSRRFRDSTGTTPAQWVLNARLDRARRLLEQTALSTEQVAARCGFGTVWDWGKRAECAGCA
jgi:AraC-like DNA-binding protein